MKRIVDFLNMCLVTNRGCNLRCTHCYIEPELLKSTYGMDEETFRLVYQRMAEVFALSKHLSFLNVEILGGEITRMPYEFWEKMLPFAIAEHERLGEVVGKPSALAWCTNMIFQDERYLGLINQQPNDKDWAVFIPWEPDTNRFGSRDKLFPRYLKNVQAVTAPKTLNIIPTKKLVSMPIEELRAFVIEGGFNDISCDMLYPYGSGKRFFDEHQPTFEQVSDFYIRMTESLKTIEGLTISPWDEVRGSLQQGRGFNLNGNDVFDVTVEPDGTVVLNSSMTGAEAPLPSQMLHVSDPLWGIKLIFENAKEMHIKFDLEQKECDQCEYMRFCNGGYYHYKYLTVEQLEQYNQGDCAGYKKYWQYVDKQVKGMKTPVVDINHQRQRELLRKHKGVDSNPLTTGVLESSLSTDYQGYFEALTAMDFGKYHIVVDQDRVLGLSVIERLWFYDALGASLEITPEQQAKLSVEHQYQIARNAASDNYASLRLEPEVVWDFATTFPDHFFARRILDAVLACRATPLLASSLQEAPSLCGSGLVVDERNDELFRFVLMNSIPDDVLQKAQLRPTITISRLSSEYLQKLGDYVRLESILRDRGVVHK